MTHWRPALLLLPLVFAAGCIELNQTVTLNADGSGTLKGRRLNQGHELCTPGFVGSLKCRPAV